MFHRFLVQVTLVYIKKNWKRDAHPVIYYVYDVHSVSSLFLLGCALHYCSIYGVLLFIYQHVCIIFRAMGNVII